MTKCIVCKQDTSFRNARQNALSELFCSTECHVLWTTTVHFVKTTWKLPRYSIESTRINHGATPIQMVRTYFIN